MNTPFKPEAKVLKRNRDRQHIENKMKKEWNAAFEEQMAKMKEQFATMSGMSETEGLLTTETEETVLNEVSEEIITNGGEATPIVCDISDSKSVIQAVTGIEIRFSRVDILINNAGYGVDGAFEAMSDDIIEKQFLMSTNCSGTDV